jgi:hypothetical protein
MLLHRVTALVYKKEKILNWKEMMESLQLRFRMIYRKTIQMVALLQSKKMPLERKSITHFKGHSQI